MHAAFDDELVTLAAPAQLSELAAALASRTRLAVLQALIRSPAPLHINEVARQVGVDASPARGHLEALVKVGLAREVDAPTGRERRFETTCTEVRVVLEGVHRVRAPEKGIHPTKEVARLEKRLASLEKDRARLDAKARNAREGLAAAWARAAHRPPATAARREERTPS